MRQGVLQLPNGVFRTTYRGRFKELDQATNVLLQKHYDHSLPLNVQDWAASDCLTSAEWARTLFPLFPNAHFIASDLTLFLIEARLPDGTAFVLDPEGNALQYVRPPFVIRMNPPEPLLLFVNRLLQKQAERKLLMFKKQLEIPEEWLNDEHSEEFIQTPFMFRKISLVHPEAEALRRSSGRFEIHRHSVFQPLPKTSDVIRTMSIFIPVYFSGERVIKGARAVWNSLKSKGLWILDGSIFIKEKDRFRVLERFRERLEIEDSILSLRV